MAIHFVVEEAQSLVNIAHDPGVGVDVEAVDEMLKPVRLLKDPQLDVGTTIPLDRSVLPLAVVSEAREYDSALGQEPRCDVFGQNYFHPNRKIQALLQDSERVEFWRFNETLRHQLK